MIIACPECATRYTIADNAIGTAGRTVRCANCRHSWFQEPASPEPAVGEPSQARAAAPADAGAAIPQEQEDAAYQADSDEPPSSLGGAADPESTDELTGRSDTAEAGYEEPSDAPVPEVRPKRHVSAKLWVGVAFGFAAAVAAIVGAASVWGMPEWLPIGRATFASSQPDLLLRFPAEMQDRRTLANGTEFFGASGSITNIGRKTRRVPPILIVLRDQSDRVVYRWEVSPPKLALAPGESVTINEAVTDVPPSASVVQVGWKPG